MTEVTLLPQASGHKIPIVGLGTWTAKGTEMEEALDYALEVGYRHLDTAFLYRNEKSIGNVLNRWITSGKIKREELFIVTKLPTFGNRPSGVEKYLSKSLESLQLEYVDLYLIHSPFGFPDTDDENNPYSFGSDGNVTLDLTTDIIGIWKAMENEVRKGRAKGIGLSNFNVNQIQRVLNSCTIKPDNLQIELHIFLQQKELVDFCKEAGMTVTAYSTLGSSGGIKLLQQQGRNIKGREPLKHPKVIELAEKYKKSTGQILLRHLVQKGIIVIPKSSNKDRIKQNIQLFDWSLTDKDMTALNSLDEGENGRFIDFRGMMTNVNRHPEYPF